MKTEKSVEKLIGDLADRTSADMDERVLKDSLQALEKSQETSSASQTNTWRRTTKICASAAAAVIVVVLLIGITIFSGPREQPKKEIDKEQERGFEKAFAERGGKVDATKAEFFGAERKLDVELANVKKMFKAGDVDGLVAMLAEGEFESKVASANYLAQMGAVKAVEPLENLSNKYDRHDTDNVFSRAVEIINNRAGAERDDNQAGTRTTNTGVVAQDEIISSTMAMNRGRGELSETSMWFEDWAKEVADGNPIKAGGSSIAEVVPVSLHQNLVLYCSFYADDDPGIAVDISGNNLHGQVHGAKYAKDEILGWAMSFDGEDDYISIPDVYLKEFSFSAWVKTQGSGINNRRIFLLSDGTNCYGLQGNVGGCVGIYVGDDKEINEYNWRLGQNAWTHITVTHDGRRFAIYRNGRLTEAGGMETSGVTGTLYLGGIDMHRGGFWRGMLDEVAFFNKALSEEEVGQLYLMTGEVVELPETVGESSVVNVENELVEVSSESFTKHTVATGFTVRSVYPADVDGDGDMDVIGAVEDNDGSSSFRGLTRSGARRPRLEIASTISEYNKNRESGITWWENTNGTGTEWTAHTVDANFGGVINAYPADVDLDGDVDILGSDQHTEDIIWWENTKGDGTVWSRHTVDAHSNGAQLVAGVDIDNDRDIDVVGATFLDGGINWWENTAGNGSIWEKHTIDGTTNADYCRTHCLRIADMDSDGKLDIVASAGRESGINWWENPKDDEAAWTRHYVVGSDGEVESVFPADLDGDGDTDLIGSIRRHDGLTWWENTSGTATEWTKHVIDASYDAEQNVDSADMDGDGDLDIIAGARRINSVIWWENTNGKATEWAKHTMTRKFGGVGGVYAADMDGDGDLDTLAAAGDTDEIAWFENQPNAK